MIKVGIVMLFGNDWLGGINYFNNLFNAVKSLPDNQIEFTILTGHDVDETRFRAFPPMRIVKSRIFDRYTLPWICRKVLYRLFQYDFLLERLLKQQGIQLLSHSGVIGNRADLPTIGWVPDFQHVHLPGFFSAQEIARRNTNFSNYANWSTVLLLSSQDALKDLKSFSPTNVPRARVLNFTVDPRSMMSKGIGLADLEGRYGFSGRYFLLPNQFWAHKNHRVVIQALAELKARQYPVLVIATGNTEDNRNPGFFAELKAYISELGVENQFRILGIIPLADLHGLMQYADAVINPSLFEGWSTTVEEAKTLNKLVILSDIGVHREQAPTHGLYFKPDDAKALADRMEEVSRAELSCPEHGEGEHQRALERFQDYGRAYHALVMELIHG